MDLSGNLLIGTEIASYSNVFTDLSFISWFTFGGFGFLSIELCHQKLYDIHVRNI